MALQITTSPVTAALGADGDYALVIDASTGSRYFQGPKASGAWPSQFFSLQGPSGPALLTGNGAPISGLGAQGQGYADLSTGTTYLKSSGGWGTVLVGALLGPPGPVGTVGLSLTGQSFSAGPQAGLATATTTTANSVLPVPGTGVAQVYSLPANAYFAGLAYLNTSNSGGSFTVNLYDQTAGVVLYTSASIPIGTVSNASLLANPIAITAGNQLVWRISAGSNLLGTVTPYFLLPGTSSVGPSMWPTAAITTDTSYTATKQILRIPGANVTTGPAQYIYAPKSTYFQYATIQVTGNASVTCYLQTGSTVIYTSPTVSSSNSFVSTNIFGSSSYPLAANTAYSWFVSGSGTGQVYVNTSTVG